MADNTDKAEEQQTGFNTPGPENVKIDASRAAIGGILSAVVALGGAWLVGEASGAEAHMLLETTLPSTRSFCGTITLALGNILALMLTLLSLSASTDINLRWTHYQRVKQVAWVVTVVLVASVLLYLLLNIPLSEADKPQESPGPWFARIYYATLVISSLLAGALISIALMLYNTVRDVIHVLGPEKPGWLVRKD